MTDDRNDRLSETEVEILMVKIVDGQATEAEEARLADHVVHHPELARELAAHRALKATTDGWVARVELDLAEDAWRTAPSTTVARQLGTGLVVAGVAVLGGFGLWELWLDPTAPLWVKLGSSLVLGGLIVLLASVVRWRMATRASDRYTEVIR